MITHCRSLIRPYCNPRWPQNFSAWHPNNCFGTQRKPHRGILSYLLTSFKYKATSTKNNPSVWRRVKNKMFGEYLLVTNIASTGVLMVIGDCLTQIINYLYEPTENGWDFRRCGRMFLVGSLMGPLHHYAYLWMDKVMPIPNMRNVLIKLLIDQFCLSPSCILIFFYAACFLENSTIEEANKEIVSKFFYIYLIDWTYWPPVQYLNYRYLDTKYRVMYVNVATAIYNVFLSYMKHEFQVDL